MTEPTLPTPATNNPIRRFMPAVDLPPYSYVPGQFPHPIHDPQGHSYGKTEPAEPVSDQTWPASIPYLSGIDWFNFGYYWEAHEIWESLWHGCGRTGIEADFIKGLIKLAAAGVKVREGQPEGVRRHARRAAQLFDQTAGRAADPLSYMGLSLCELTAQAQAVEAQPPPTPASQLPIRPLFSFALSPILPG